MAEFKIIETQEQLDNIIAERLKRQKESLIKEYEPLKNENESLKNELTQVKKSFESLNTEKDSFTKQLETLNGKIKDYEVKDLKLKIALENNIPYSLAGRLQGDDEESILKDAKNLSEYVVNTNKVAPLKSTEPKVDNKDASYKKLLENIEGE